jgi:predicted dehydrogenase
MTTTIASTTRRDLLRRGAALATAVGTLVASPAFLPAAGERSARVKVGLVGTAHSHAAGKLESLRRLADLYEVVGVAEPDEQRRKALAGRREYAGLPWLTEEQLLNTPGLRAVLVETAVADLVPAASRAAAAGLHVHLEKPAGPSLPKFRELLETVRRKGRVLQMGYMFRRNPAFELCLRFAREGWLGEVYEVHGVMGKVMAPRDRKDVAEFAGGLMFELGAHLVDSVVAVLGKPQRVHAHLRHTRPDQDHLADNTLAVFEYPKALATVRSAAADVEGFARRQFVVCGDQGAATILPLEPPRLTLTLDRPRGDYRKGTQAVELRRMPGRYDDQLADFARVVRGDKAVDYGPDHDLTVHETLLRASGMPTD